MRQARVVIRKALQAPNGAWTERWQIRMGTKGKGKPISPTHLVLPWSHQSLDSANRAIHAQAQAHNLELHWD